MVKVKERIYSLDEIRGVMLIGIVLYHLGYDLALFTKLPMDWFWGGFVSTIRYIMAGTFMVVSGVSCSLSRSNLRRGIKTFCFAMVLTAATFFAMPEQIITFGVLHYFGVMTVIFALTKHILTKINPFVGMAISTMLFYLTYNIPSGFIQIFTLRVNLPSWLYGTKFLFWLGLPNSSFLSSDYYPILPWGWLFMLGGFMGMYFKKNGFPRWSMEPRSRFLGLIGKQTLIIYLVHQPIFLGLMWLFGLI